MKILEWFADSALLVQGKLKLPVVEATWKKKPPVRGFVFGQRARPCDFKAFIGQPLYVRDTLTREFISGMMKISKGFTTFCPIGNLMVGQSIELKNGEYHWRCIVESKSNEAVILKPFLDLNRRPL